MEENYYRNLKKTTLTDYARELKNSQMLPSRKLLQENTSEHFALLSREGMEDLDAVLTRLKTKEAVPDCARKTKISLPFLTALVREIKSLCPKPNKLKEIPSLTQKSIDTLEALKIKSTRDLFPHIRTKAARKNLSRKTGIHMRELTELARLTDLSRIKYVGAIFARVLVDSGYDTVEKVATAEAQS